jgi:hypothetical protein
VNRRRNDKKGIEALEIRLQSPELLFFITFTGATAKNPASSSIALFAPCDKHHEA